MKVTVCTLEGNSTTTKLEQYYFMDPTIQSMQIDSYYKEYLYEFQSAKNDLAKNESLISDLERTIHNI